MRGSPQAKLTESQVKWRESQAKVAKLQTKLNKPQQYHKCCNLILHQLQQNT
ncbi:hypothetical protein NiCM35_17060 [Niallia circulans]|uniref:hypothetical protein n=1 Tax=Niallia circulans TaxID=1397 RepID=UPI003D98498D